MKRNWWLILIIVCALAATFPYVFKTKSPQVKIGDKIFNIEIAKTNVERAKGLSGRDSLAPDTGMLFIFPRSDIYSFWMKDTSIPLDILWIQDNKIVDITTLNPPTDNYIPSYTPKEKANYVLELNANSGLKIGENVKIEI